MDKLDILGTPYKVEWWNKPIPYKKRICFGQAESRINGCRGNVLRVYEEHPAFVLETFWHEMVHAILDEMRCFGLSRNEEFVGQLTHIIAATLLANPKLLPIMQKWAGGKNGGV